MKKILLLILTILCFAATAYADDMPAVGLALKQYDGSWYNENGEEVFTVNSGDCTIVGKETLKIEEIDIVMDDEGWTGYKFITTKDGDRLETTAVIDNRGKTHFWGNDGTYLPYRSTKEIEYFESVGGIYLGMSKTNVENIYGGGDSMYTSPIIPILEEENKNFPYIRKYTVTYSKDGFEIGYAAGRVESITLFKGGSRSFDKSGLNCENSMSDFAKAYNIKKPGYTKANEINDGEYLFFDKESGNITIAKYDKSL